MQRIGSRAAPALFAAAAMTLTASSAFAFGNGQTGYTGRTGSCLQCHGSKQYAGLTVVFPEGSATADTSTPYINCATADGSVLELPRVDFGGEITLKVQITDPGGELGCPSEADDTKPGYTTCDEPAAGFNAEVVNGGELLPADGATRNKEVGGELFTNEITHSAPEDFTGGPAEWTVTFKAPEEADYRGAVELWVGANVANGNGYADGEDLNSNYKAAIAIGDYVPAFCGVCDGGTLPDDGGVCGGGGSGCAASTVPATGAPVTLGALFLLGLGLRRRATRKGC